MKYFKTKHEKDAAKITTLVVLILLLLIFVVGPKYTDPPQEYGVAVNFGTTDFGSGKQQPTLPVQSEPLPINKIAQTETTKAESSAKPSAENILTQETEDAVAIQKQKEAKEQAIAKNKAKAEADRIAKEKQEQEEKKKKLDALIGGVSKSEGKENESEGDNDKSGNKGKLNGNPYAPSYFGDPGTGNGSVGYGLNGRGTPTKQIFKQNCNESGMVIVKIVVDRSGNVIEATPGIKGTTNTASCLLEPAKKIALSHKWRTDNNAPAKQIGFVKVNFLLGQ